MRSRLAFVQRIFFFLACILAVFFSSSSLAGPGALEQKSLLTIPGGDNKALAMTVQSDGKILAAGYAYFGTQQFAITRYSANGTIDTTFGEAGTRLEWLGPGNAEAHGIAVQSSGKVVVGGFAVSDKSRFGLARFNSDGSLDLTFGGGGAVTEIGTDSAAYAMALQADDKILLGGWSISGGKKVFTIARYDADTPLLDTGFGSGGAVIAAAGTNDQQINALAVQPDGKIVAAGSDGASAIVVRRYNPDGSLDTGFASGGTFSSTSMAGARDLAILGNGDILVAGEVPGGSAFEVARLTASGALDTTFGAGGFAQQGVGGGALANGLAVQGDGKIVVAGTGSGPAVAVARFNANGSNDTGFGTSGVTLQQFTSTSDEGNDVAVLSSGRIVVAGTGGTSSAHEALLAGFTAGGALDGGFGTSGSVLADAGSKQSAGRASALQSDGKLVVAGIERPTPTSPSVTSTVVARYLADGSLDTAFGSGGWVALGPEQANAVAIQPDGKIVVAGWADASFSATPAHRVAVSRLLLDGTLDTSFGGTGTVFVTLASPTEEANAVAIQGDGKIVVGGRGQNGSFLDAMFVRFNTDGSLDTGFGGTGKVFVAMSTGNDQVNAIAIQGDGRIVGVGDGNVSSSQDSVMLTRLNTDGSVDTGFGTGGVATTSVGTTTSNGNAVALQSDGKIVVGGQWFNPSGTTDDFLVARYAANGTLDGTFGSGGIVTTDAGNHNRLFSVAILPSGKIVGSGLTADGFALVQYLADGTLDTTFGTSGTVYQPINAGADVGYSIQLRSDGKFWVAGDGTNLLATAIFTGDGGSTPKSTATASLSSSRNPSTTGQSVTFSVSVSGAVGTPTGTVSFLDGTSAISGCASVALTAGGATCATSSLHQGSHAISATYSGDAAYNAATSNTLTQTVQDVATFALTVTKSGTGSGTVTSAPAGINCGATCSASFTSGTSVTLSAAADSGSTFAGWSGGGCSGTAACTVTMSASTSVTATFTAATSDPVRLTNLSTRMQVLTGENVLIGGFIVGGSSSKTVVVRARGPSLAAFGISNALANPTLQLVRSSDQSVVATNDDWGSASNAGDITASGFAPSDARESAILVTLPPGAYTAIVSGVGGTTGVGIVEVFEVDHPEIPLANISTRGQVLTGNNVMIGGFVVQGSGSQTVIVRARGPSLAAFGVANPLANPTLQIVRSSDQSVVATNDDWQSASNASQISASGFAPSDSRESAILVTLPPGGYTAIVSGVGNTTGVGLVEVFTQ